MLFGYMLFGYMLFGFMLFGCSPAHYCVRLHSRFRFLQR